MMFLGMFRSDLQKVVKWVKIRPSRAKNGLFFPLFVRFRRRGDMPCGPVRIRAASVRRRTDTPNNLDGRGTDPHGQYIQYPCGDCTDVCAAYFSVRAAAARTNCYLYCCYCYQINKLSVRRVVKLSLLSDYQINRLSVRQRYSVRAASVRRRTDVRAAYFVRAASVRRPGGFVRAAPHGFIKKAGRTPHGSARGRTAPHG